jgi:4-hydroxybenzoate polyprenyltransferase
MNLRTLLVLGRVSNLPTVWSNLLAGWLLNRGQCDSLRLALILLGGSLIYIGGMYLNDYCDAEFDSRFCPHRPIPAGKISRRFVGVMAFLWFLAGFACLASLGSTTATIALELVLAIVIYDFHHKNVAWAPWVMGLCRFLLYPLAAEAVPFRKFDFTLFNVDPSGAALALYVIGITYIARGESRPGKPTRWALVLLLMPLFLSAFLRITGRNDLEQPTSSLWLVVVGALLLAWMGWLLIPLWLKIYPSIGRVVSGLLAGIVLVDIIAVTPRLGLQSAWFLILFLIALLLQRFVPAT